jgi:mRNA interferase RelE/StbE
MNVNFKARFAKDLKKIANVNILNQIKTIIEQVEEAQNLQDIKNLKKLKIGNVYYRIRVGYYRIGLLIEDEVVTFVRCLHRKDFYKFFP